MKSRKTRILVALGLVAIGSFSLMVVSATVSEKTIKSDLTNAIQRIPKVKITSTDYAKEAELTNLHKLFRINTNSNGFVLGDGNSQAGDNSTVLGGKGSITSSNYNTIIGGDNDVIYGSNGATILGGKGNKIRNSSSDSAIAGGNGNTVDYMSNGVVIGSNNSMNGGAGAINGVVVGNNSTADKTNSVALGENSNNKATSSFLWTDSTHNGILTDVNNNTFVVVAGSGMVVNTGKAHNFAQLTIGGSLTIDQGQSPVCGGGKGKGVLRVVNNTSNTSLSCFCSCDGTSWSSLFGAGMCSSSCNSNVKPVCDNRKVDKICTSTGYVYSGYCEVGDVVEGVGAYVVEDNQFVHWSCQTNNGEVRMNCGTTNIEEQGSCVHDPHYDCIGSYDNAYFLTGRAVNLSYTDRLTSQVFNSEADVPANVKCAWVCNPGWYVKGKGCAEYRPCNADSSFMRLDPHFFDGFIGFDVPGLGHGETATVHMEQVVDGGVRKCEGRVSCNDSTLSLEWDNGCPLTEDCTEQYIGNYFVPGFRIGQYITRHAYDTGYVYSDGTHGKIDNDNKEGYYDCRHDAFCNDGNPTLTGAESCTYGCYEKTKEGYNVPALGNGVTYKADGIAEDITSGGVVIGSRVCKGKFKCNNGVLSFEGTTDCEIYYNGCASNNNINGEGYKTTNYIAHGATDYAHKEIPGVGGCDRLVSCSYGTLSLIGQSMCNLMCSGTEPEGSNKYYKGAGNFTDESHTPTSWSRVNDTTTPGACQWRCNTANGYGWNGSDCVLNTYTCGGNKPSGNKYKLGATSYTYGYTPSSWSRVSDTATPGACQYRCNTEAGYGWNGSDCVLNTYTCGGNKPSGNKYKLGATSYTYGYTPSSWSRVSDSTNPGACQWRCNKEAGYSWDGTDCAEPPVTSYSCSRDEANKCEGSDGSVVDGSTPKTHTNSEYTWYCGSTQCAMCDDGTIPENIGQGECESINYYYLSFETEKNGSWGNYVTYVIMHVKDENNASAVVDDELNLQVQINNCNVGGPFDRDIKLYGGEEDGDSIDGVTSVWCTGIGYAEFNENQDGDVIIDSTKTIATVGNNVYEIVGSYTPTNYCGGTTPTGNKYKLGSTTYAQGYTPSSWTRVSDTTDPGACQYRCNKEEGYSWNGSDCVLTCGGNKPTGNKYKLGATVYVEGYTPSSWTRVSDTTAPGACQYRCNKEEGYSWNGTDCTNTITINVSCSIVYERPGQASLWGCDGPAWMNTIFSTDKLLPAGLDLKITETLKYHQDNHSDYCSYGNEFSRSYDFDIEAGSNYFVDEMRNHEPTAWNDIEGYQSYYDFESYSIGIPSKGISNIGLSMEVTVNGQTYKIVKEECTVSYEPLYVCKGTRPEGEGYKFGDSAYTDIGYARDSWTYSSASTLGACQYGCDAANGYVWNSASSKCVLSTYTCGGSKPSGNKYKLGATSYTYGYTPTTWTRVSDASNPGACQYRCNTEAGYRWNGSDCVLICGGSKPSGNEWQLGGTTYTQGYTPSSWTRVSDSTTPGACQYRCNTEAGYSWDENKGACVLTCGGTKPSGDKWQLGGTTYTQGYTPTTWTRVGDSTTPGACQYRCNTAAGYSWNGSDCVLTCGGTKPSGDKWQLGGTTYTQGYTPTTWTRVSDSTTPGACQYRCNTAAGYTWNGSDCIKEEHLSCSKTQANKCVDAGGNVTDGSAPKTHTNNEYTWYCGDTKCAMCDDGTIPENPGNLECVETVTINCCTSIPEHGVPIYVDEDVDEDVGSAPLCSPLLDNGNGGYEIGEAEDGCWYENQYGQHTDGCGWSRYCCMDDNGVGLSQISCGSFSESFCGDEPLDGTEIDKFYCEDGYHLDGCDCVENPKCGYANGRTYSSVPPTSERCSIGSASPVSETGTGWSWGCDKNGITVPCSAKKPVSLNPISIDISCSTNYDYPDSNSLGCYEGSWTSTRFTASEELPITVFIGQNMYLYGRSAGYTDGCHYHRADTAVAKYAINAGNKYSELVNFPASGVGWDPTYGFDAMYKHGASSFVNDASSQVGEIRSLVTDKTVTIDGQEYIIRLSNDCVEPKCGSAHGQTLSSQPDSDERCYIGSPSSVTPYTNYYSWTCSLLGEYDNCRAERVSANEQVITLVNNSNKVVKVFNSSENPFYFDDTSYGEDCDGNNREGECNLRIPQNSEVAIKYKSCSTGRPIYAQACRGIDANICGTQYQFNVSCSTTQVDLYDGYANPH